jgi:NAD(P)H-flavin reductase
MFKILSMEKLTPVIDCLKLEAAAISQKARAGQFVIIRVDELGERVPLTLADWDAAGGTITLVAQEVGTSTRKLGAMKAGDSIANLVGPLGLATHIEKYGTVVCVGGGVGIAPIYPIARSMKQAGNKVLSIIGARNKELLFWEDKMRMVSDELTVTTDDGSYARKGLVTEPLKVILEREKVDRVIAIGPAIMMKFCSLTTKPFNIPTIVSLNSIMVDCVDGPDFDGHQVDWDIVFDRQKVYLKEEKESLDNWEACQCQK